MIENSEGSFLCATDREEWLMLERNGDKSCE